MKTHYASLLIVLAGLILPTAAYGDDDLEFEAKLTGAQEVPPVVTAASGDAKFEVNKALTKIEFELEIECAVDILAVAGAHIHCGAAGENGPVVASLTGAVSGGFDGEVEMEASLTQANIVNDACGATIAELVQSMIDGQTYVNVYSTAHPGGEVRGQIMAEDEDDDDD